LPSWRKKVKGKVKPLLEKVGYARERWRAMGRGIRSTLETDPGTQGADKKRLGLGYYLEVAGHELEASLAWVQIAGSGKNRKATWKTSDFYVPPGFWAVGVGERFMEELVLYLKKEEEVFDFQANFLLKGKPPSLVLAALYAHPEVKLELVPPPERPDPSV
jgi:hypothetical protein